MSGASGHTYGANGIWQLNTRRKPYGRSPSLHGNSWGGPPWEIAAQLPGSGQLGLGHKLLSRYSWWKLEPRPELVEPRWSKEDYWQCFTGEIPGEAIVAYSPCFWRKPVFHRLQAATYKAFFFNPSDGTEVPIGDITPDGSGTWKAAEFPIARDWIIVLEHKA